MTLDEISYNILNLLRGGRSNHDELIPLEQIKFNVLHYRAMFIRRDYARNGTITRHLEQDLKCLELEAVDQSKCCGDFNLGCTIKKTKKKIPRTVRFNFEDAITFVGVVDGMTRIQLISPQMAKFASYAKYTGKNKKAFMIEDYLYILNPEGIDQVNVRGIFEDPRDLRLYDCDEGHCWDEKMDFPLPMDMVQLITTGMASGELQLLMGTVNDQTGDRVQDMQNMGLPKPQGGGGGEEAAQ